MAHAGPGARAVTGALARLLTAREVREWGLVYALDLVDHHTGEVVAGDYVGQSRQELAERVGQHERDSVFGDVIDDAYVIAEGMFTDAELTELEYEYIRGMLPRMNVRGNGMNPDRIPREVAEVQRWERDDTAGVQRWRPPRVRRAAASPGRSWWWRPAVGWLAVWAVLAAGLCVLVGDGWSGWQNGYGVGFAGGVVWGVRSKVRKPRRGRRRRRRRR